LLVAVATGDQVAASSRCAATPVNSTVTALKAASLIPAFQVLPEQWAHRATRWQNSVLRWSDQLPSSLRVGAHIRLLPTCTHVSTTALV
jgi:hypothetical protein